MPLLYVLHLITALYILYAKNNKTLFAIIGPINHITDIFCQFSACILTATKFLQVQNIPDFVIAVIKTDFKSLYALFNCDIVFGQNLHIMMLSAHFSPPLSFGVPHKSASSNARCWISFAHSAIASYSCFNSAVCCFFSMCSKYLAIALFNSSILCR